MTYDEIYSDLLDRGYHEDYLDEESPENLLGLHRSGIVDDHKTETPINR
jgi:hypothetical protein